MLTLLIAGWTRKDLGNLLAWLDGRNELERIQHDVKTIEEFHAWLTHVEVQRGMAAGRSMAVEQRSAGQRAPTRKRSKRLIPDLPALERAWERAQRLCDWATRQGLHVVGRYDELFPERLRTIPDPPVLVFVRGPAEILRRREAVAIVGTRAPTPIGERLARETAAWFARRGVVVVSGLAEGCDTAAHRACLDAGGQTVAVLAQGLGTAVYPASNRDLAHDIVAHGGCLVSEYLPYERPQRHYFIERDRLQSALSAAVIVVETGYRGGTMHTVRYAGQQHRTVACLVPAGHERREWEQRDQALGNLKLIADRSALELAVDDRALDQFWRSIGSTWAPSCSPAAQSAGRAADIIADMSISDQKVSRKRKRSVKRSDGTQLPMPDIDEP
jgi:DNA processing protein